jgi:hypothetical protein
LQEVESLKLEPDYDKLTKEFLSIISEIYENDNAKTEITTLSSNNLLITIIPIYFLLITPAANSHFGKISQ